MLNGIDVCDAQGWSAVAAHNRFAFIRGAYGDPGDTRHQGDYEDCRANRLRSACITSFALPRLHRSRRT
jgi:hypothetical protein